MRTEEQMLRLIAAVAQADDRIRAAYLEGSRANPKIPRDIFQDYDVVYLVTDTKPYRQDRSWIDRFGRRLYMQYPEENSEYPADVENCYGWLMQLADGNRLDLHVCTRNYALSHLELYRVLVDKDQIFSERQQDSDAVYWVRRPEQAAFSFACNEFWWCLNNVAKGLWRNEITYVMDVLNDPVRPMLRRLLDWKIGMEHGFAISTGKSSKYMNRFLPEEIYRQYLQTYPQADRDGIWRSVFVACDLFDRTARAVAAHLGLVYDAAEGESSYAYLRHVQQLPADAEAVF